MPLISTSAREYLDRGEMVVCPTRDLFPAVLETVATVWYTGNARPESDKPTDSLQDDALGLHRDRVFVDHLLTYHLSQLLPACRRVGYAGASHSHTSGSRGETVASPRRRGEAEPQKTK